MVGRDPSRGVAVLARMALVSCIGCDLVSGLDQLKKVPCVEACEDTAGAINGDDATTPDSASDVAVLDASPIVDAPSEADATLRDGPPPADAPSEAEITLSADASPATDATSEAEAMPPLDAPISSDASMDDSPVPDDSSNDAGICSSGTALSRTHWASNPGTTASDDPGSMGNMFDGSLTTRWSTTRYQVFSPAEWLEIDLGCSQSFSQVVLQNGTDPRNVNDYPRGYALQVSTDNVNWKQVASGTGSTVTPIAFASVTARYIRVNQTGSSTTNWWSVDELNVCGTTSRTC